MLDKDKAQRMFAIVRSKVGEDVHEPFDFDDLDASQFLGEYCWAVFASGSRFKVAKDKFPEIKELFCSFVLELLAGMAPAAREGLPIRNKRKADCFLQG